MGMWDKLLDNALVSIKPSWRKGQKEVAQEILESLFDNNYNNFILNAPTGWGKSVLAYTIARAAIDSPKTSVHKVAILTFTKVLQDQYYKEFEGIDYVALIKGQDNYNCSILKEVPYSQAPCNLLSMSQRRKLPCAKNCPYMKALNAVTKAPIVITNYHYYFLSYHRKIKNPFDLIIFDEAHNLENLLVSLFSPKYDRDLYNSLLRIENFLSSSKWDILKNIYKSFNKDISDLRPIFMSTFNKLKTPEDYLEENKKLINAWALSAQQANSLLKPIADIQDTIKNISDMLTLPSPITADEMHDFNNLLKSSKTFNFVKHILRLKTSLELVTTSIKKGIWIGMNTSREKKTNPGIKLLPLDLRQWSYFVFSEERKHLFMSATLPPEFAIINFHLPSSKTRTKELKHIFPKKNRPIYYLPVVKINYENVRKKETWEKINMVITDIINIEKDNKGIIHAVSFENTLQVGKYLKERFPELKIFIHQPIHTLSELLKEFKNYKGPAVLISPSILEGVDLPGDDSRFQIFIKVPFPSLADRRYAAMLKISKLKYKYYYYAALALMQGYGRSIRSADDYARTYIIDKSFGFLLRRFKFPRWFTEAIISR